MLLAGVNDCVNIQRDLVQQLVEMRVRPYYLYQCDLVEGSGHFRTPVGKGLEIMEGLRGHTSGYAVPTFVIDAPGGGGKIPVMPNYLVSYSDHKVVLRNYEGYITTYEEPLQYQQHDRSTLRVVPAATPRAGPGRHPRAAPGRPDVDRAARVRGGPHPRNTEEQHRLKDPSKWVPYGVGAIEGQAQEPGNGCLWSTAPSPPPRATAPNPVYPPGEEPRPADGQPTATANHELL